MAVATKPKLDVQIYEETYFLNEVPSVSSAVVRSETRKLLGAINLKTLVDDLGRVGSLIRIAYNGCVAAGPRFTDQQIKIQRLGYDVTRLCNTSALTIAKFETTSSTILTDLQSTFAFLLENFESMALLKLSKISKRAGDMEKAALELCTEFDAEEKKVEKILEETQRARGVEAEDIARLRNEREQIELKEKDKEQLLKECDEKEKVAEARRRYLEQEIDKVATDSILEPLKILVKIVNAITSHYAFGLKLFEDDDGVKRVALLKEPHREALQNEQSIRRERHEARSMMTELASKLKECDTDESMAKFAEEALHIAIGQFKELSAVMMQAANFWKMLQQHCQLLAETEMQNMVEEAMGCPAKVRLQMWTSTGFMVDAIHFYARWVALSSVCKEYVVCIKSTQQDFHSFIKENPTREESRQNVKVLVTKFLSNLQHDQTEAELTDNELEAQSEIEALGDSDGDF